MNVFLMFYSGGNLMKDQKTLVKQIYLNYYSTINRALMLISALFLFDKFLKLHRCTL